MDSKSKNEYVDKFDNIVNKCNNTYQTTVKIMSGDVRLSMYIDFDKAKYKKKHKIFLQRAMFLFGLKIFISDLNGEEIIWKFYEKGLQKTNQKVFILEKSDKKKKR